MKGFERNNPLFSLCGLNCGLCPMNLAGHCAGCGVDNQSCKIAKCSLEHGNVEYCFQCTEYPCRQYEHIDDYDSFITHRNQTADIQKAKEIGISAYNREQLEKRKILDVLLENFNDGRKKNLFCIAVNLLELEDLRCMLRQMEDNAALEKDSLKEKSAFAASLLRALAVEKNLSLKLRKK